MSVYTGVKHSIDEREAAERKAEANDAAATVLAIECGELRQRVKELEAGKAYLVIQFRAGSPEFQGVFSTYSKACDACKDWSDVVAEFQIDKELPREEGQYIRVTNPKQGLELTSLAWVPIREPLP